MARVTFATAVGHPLGPQQRLTSVFVPYRRVVPPILFDLAFVRDFALALALLWAEYIQILLASRELSRGGGWRNNVIFF